MLIILLLWNIFFIFYHQAFCLSTRPGNWCKNLLRHLPIFHVPPFTISNILFLHWNRLRVFQVLKNGSHLFVLQWRHVAIEIKFNAILRIVLRLMDLSCSLHFFTQPDNFIPPPLSFYKTEFNCFQVIIFNSVQMLLFSRLLVRTNHYFIKAFWVKASSLVTFLYLKWLTVVKYGHSSASFPENLQFFSMIVGNYN